MPKGDEAAKAEPPHYEGHRHRLRERFLRGGAEALADYELLELILFQAIRRGDVKPVAKALLARFGSFGAVAGDGNTNGIVRNLTLSGLWVTTDSQAYRVGGLCGALDGTLENCHVRGDLHVGANSLEIGGVCGVLEGGTIVDCSVDITITVGLSCAAIGGLCGQNNALISACLASGSLSGPADWLVYGAICGNNGDTVADCIGEVLVPYPSGSGLAALVAQGNAPVNAYSGGDGTQSNPFRLTSAHDVLVLSDSPPDWTNHFTLATDIDLAGEVFAHAVIGEQARIGRVRKCRKVVAAIR